MSGPRYMSGGEIVPVTWRTGRHVGRTIYAQAGPEPSDSDLLIGVMDTPELAAEACGARNRLGADGAALTRRIGVTSRAGGQDEVTPEAAAAFAEAGLAVVRRDDLRFDLLLASGALGALPAAAVPGPLADLVARLVATAEDVLGGAEEHRGAIPAPPPVAEDTQDGAGVLRDAGGAP